MRLWEREGGQRSACGEKSVWRRGIESVSVREKRDGWMERGKEMDRVRGTKKNRRKKRDAEAESCYQAFTWTNTMRRPQDSILIPPSLHIFQALHDLNFSSSVLSACVVCA
jgi:hypothetical protein